MNVCDIREYFYYLFIWCELQNVAYGIENGVVCGEMIGILVYYVRVCVCVCVSDDVDESVAFIDVF